MLQAQNSFAKDNFFSPVEQLKPAIAVQSSENFHLLVVVEPVQALRKHFVELARKAVCGTVQFFEAGCSTELASFSAMKTPSLFVVDLNATEKHGLATAAEIWERYPDARILFWASSFKESQYQQIQMVAPPEGVYGIALKTCPDDRLVHAIQSLIIHENVFIDAEVRRSLQHEPQCNNRLTHSEFETLCDVMLGLTDKAIAKRRNLSARGVQNRLAALFSKVLRGKHSWLRESASMDVYNLRTRLIFEVLRLGLVDADSLSQLDDELDGWINCEFGV